MAGLFALALVLGACNGDDDGDSGRALTVEELVGKWLLRQVDAKGNVDVNFEFFGIDTSFNLDTTAVYTGSEYYAEFRADSTYTFNMPDDEEFVGGGLGDFGDLGDVFGGLEKVASDGGSELETGKWKLSGTTLTTISSEDDTLVQTATLVGSNLVLQYAVDTAASDTGYSFSVDANVKATLQK
jgi:hypothetical protein